MGQDAVGGSLDSGLLGGESRTVGERARLAWKREENNVFNAPAKCSLIETKATGQLIWVFKGQYRESRGWQNADINIMQLTDDETT